MQCLSIRSSEQTTDAQRIRLDSANAPQHALRERLKELNCLYGISRLVDCHGNSLESILGGIAELVSQSWQFPEICCAKLTLHNNEYTTQNYRRTVWRLSSEIRVDSEPAGILEVCYLREMAEADEGPFLREERKLIDAVAERAGKIAERIQAQRELRADRAALQKANTALREVLTQIDREKKQISESVTMNVDKVLMPLLRQLDSELPVRQRKYVVLLKKHLDHLTSPLAGRLSRAFAALTPAEVEICEMIRDGWSTKEISQFRHVAHKTVGKQREQIRTKLGIAGAKVNLATHLRMLSSGSAH